VNEFRSHLTNTLALLLGRLRSSLRPVSTAVLPSRAPSHPIDELASRNSFINTLALLLGLSCTTSAWGLPINFGRPHGDLEYQELKGDNFILYHDARTPQEAKGIMVSLEAARPHYERWLSVRRERPLPVVISAVTDNASFANFITDAVELQSMGMGGRDLAWHEYTHSTMYRHLDNWFGPTGSILHLPWMPAWWIEGLAEALSVSVGSDLQAGIEKLHVATQSWPSYDKLHALYNKGAFTLEGYATAGAFVTYLLRTYGADKLPRVMQDFYHYSMPWYWPWAAIPWVNDFMPMDAALRNWTGKSGRELYEEYQQAAAHYWRARMEQDFTTALKDQKFATFSHSHGLDTEGDRILNVLTDDDGAVEVELEGKFWRDQWDLITTWEKRGIMPPDLYYARIMNHDLRLFVDAKQDDDLKTTYRILRQMQPKDDPFTVVERSGYIERLFLTPQHILWLEHDKEFSRLCQIDRADILKRTGSPLGAEKISCPVQSRYPERLAYLGQNKIQDPGSKVYFTRDIWISRGTETLRGDHYQVEIWHADQHQGESRPLNDLAKPIAVAPINGSTWELVASHSQRFLRLRDPKGSCQKEIPLAVHATRLFGLANGKVVMPFYYKQREGILVVDPATLPSGPCSLLPGPTSPTLYAMQQPNEISLSEAIIKGSTWHLPQEGETSQARQTVSQSAPIHQEPLPQVLPLSSREAAWRGRPVFGFPWIGADALGNQLGMISVPLMDHMQDETVRLSLLYGVESRYPSTELSFYTSRFRTTWQFDLFRYQTFNGTYRNPTTNLSEVLYYDERGCRITAGRSMPTWNMDIDYGVKSSHLEPYLGPRRVRQGQLNEFFLNFSHGKRFRSFTWSNSLSLAATSEEINDNFDYNKIGLGTTLSKGIPMGDRSSTLSLGLNGSRTRGKKTLFLREFYRPLKTFVPGSGGGLNEINVGLTGPGYLTNAQYGDNQARAKASWTVPLVEDLEKLVGIFYLQRLDFTAFFNYGGAWYGSDLPTTDRLLKAHGYNLDLQSDIKGLTVNLGLGTGQVIGHAFEVYFLFGFDALIN